MMRRRQGEAILIGEDIEIVIAHIGRSRVKVGIRAPRRTRVIAREIKVVGEENRAAAEMAGDGSAAELLRFFQTAPMR
jgi:carbon storage regulator